MELIWVGTPTRGRRKLPLFYIEFWNCYELTVNHLPRTNNFLEAFHNAFHKTLGLVYPNIYRLLNALKTEQSLTNQRILRIESGELKQISSKTKQLSEKMQNVILNYENLNPLDYLSNILANFFF